MFQFLLYFVMAIFMLACVLMVALVVLLQKGRGGGISRTLGGAGGNTAFGVRTGDMLTWATSIFFGVFLILAVTMNVMAHHTLPASSGNPAAVTGSAR